MAFPVSAYTETGGIVFFARMLDKMRMHLAGRLPEPYEEKMNIGNCYNRRCLAFLGVSYEDLLRRVEQGGADEEILEWCFERGRRPSAEEIFVWNQFMVKKGWRDEESAQLEDYKRGSGLGDRNDIVTFFDYYEVDEGRKA